MLLASSMNNLTKIENRCFTFFPKWCLEGTSQTDLDAWTSRDAGWRSIIYCQPTSLRSFR